MSGLLNEVLNIPSGGKIRMGLHGVMFVLYYDEMPARGDNGLPVPGDVTGEYELWEQTGPDEVRDLAIVKRQHVSPHGTSGHGNPRAKSWAAEQIVKAVIDRTAREVASR